MVETAENKNLTNFN